MNARLQSLLIVFTVLVGLSTAAASQVVGEASPEELPVRKTEDEAILDSEPEFSTDDGVSFESIATEFERNSNRVNASTSFVNAEMHRVIGYAELNLEVPFRSQVSISTAEDPREYFVKQQGSRRCLLLPMRRSSPVLVRVAVALPDDRADTARPQRIKRYVELKANDSRRVRVTRQQIERRVEAQLIIDVLAAGPPSRDKQTAAQ